MIDKVIQQGHMDLINDLALNSCLCKDCLIISTIAFSSSTARIDLLFLLVVEAEEVISASIALRIDRYKDFSNRLCNLLFYLFDIIIISSEKKHK
jgi:hypothetical protein